MQPDLAAPAQPLSAEVLASTTADARVWVALVQTAHAHVSQAPEQPIDVFGVQYVNVKSVVAASQQVHTAVPDICPRFHGWLACW